MRRLSALIVFILWFLILPVCLQAADEAAKIVLELDQLMAMRVELELPVAPKTGFRAGGGVSLSGSTIFVMRKVPFSWIWKGACL